MDTDRLLLIVEDDEAFARTLARSFERRGYQVLHAEGIARMEELLAVHAAVRGGRPQAQGRSQRPGLRTRLARAQSANAHRGADRLCQHCHGGGSHQARRGALPGQTVQHRRHRSRFALQEGNTEVELTNRSSSIKTLEWERIHEVLAESDFNISEAARRLGMHRRTLSRKLGKQRV